jgi:hypothetical protein
MTRRRAIVLAFIWGLVMLAVTGWVTTRADQEVSFVDAVLVGGVAATVVVAAIGIKRK